MDKGRGGPRASGRSSRGTGGSLFDARETVYLADSVRGSLQDEGVNKMPSNYVLAQADRNTAASSNGAGRDTIYTTADGQRSTIGDRKERYTEGDGRTGHQTGGGRSTLYFRQGDMYTGVYEDADAAPDVKEKFAGVGEDWRAQQARWASRENGNGEEEGGEGGGAGRRAAAASGQRVDAHVNGGVGTRGSRDTDSRDSTRSVVSSGVKDLYESQQKQQEDKLSGRRFLDPAKGLAQIESLEEKKEPVVQPGRSEYKGSRIEWEKFPEVSSNWYGFNDAIV
ncbi:hypothetical protein GUITHDRAFT_137117 [Guillardia theta CCMP2712]|uniref:Uncharacterized protein n=2 Tax=Guillardia theta TaxID=55529 RepID=L1JGT2_GUITC|nr:hypothetical protein GUITHDRAFT_137117 [Guillardia theta CCMP2712]EKX47716.1 hypothetical protein GUITHDRAFT_137117 [Guillardia theta CCMP2712]|eukprot:XP_005834696.1 hypothetical protein GUITHDRAFT_137117 [Guillardia theta CCMP2712]